MNEDNYNNNENCYHLKPLYTDTGMIHHPKLSETPMMMSNQIYDQHMPFAPKPTSFPTFVKDVTRPYTYHTMSSCASANDYYVNFDSHECNDGTQVKPTFETSGCVKTYLCGIFGCLICSFYHCKPF